MPEPIQVSCYAGSRGEEAPRTFLSATSGQLLVIEIIERWVRQDVQRRQKEYFRVLASDGRIYVLYRDRSLDLWFLEQVDSKGTE
ncbi:MAG: hypothetical protein ACE5MG_01565 [Candidatus Methylomirabilales bacterium]